MYVGSLIHARVRLYPGPWDCPLAYWSQSNPKTMDGRALAYRIAIALSECRTCKSSILDSPGGPDEYALPVRGAQIKVSPEAFTSSNALSFSSSRVGA